MNQEEKYIHNVKRIRREARERLFCVNPDLQQLSLSDVKKIMVIVSHPRAGSSMLHEVLAQSARVYSLNGEAVPFYKLNIVNQAHGESLDDVIEFGRTPFSLDNESFCEDIICDLFQKEKRKDIFSDETSREEYFCDLMLRLPLQWPGIEFDLAELFLMIQNAFKNYADQCKDFDTAYFYAELLKILRSRYPEINPYYYDMDPRVLEKCFPDVSVPEGPPNDVVMVEEPPFTLLSPLEHISERDLSEKTLLLKSSVDVYRMDLIRHLFPRAFIKVLCVVRNPAASINGLYDGWQHHGFFSHNMKGFLTQANTPDCLRIKGYSEKHEFAKYWWKFDLPPGWIHYAERSLEDVCAFQWESSVSRILSLLENADYDHRLVRYENIISDDPKRTGEFKSISDLLGDESDLTELSQGKFPVIQATKQPRKFRWEERKHTIESVLSKEIIDLAREIGYSSGSREQWL